MENNTPTPIAIRNTGSKEQFLLFYLIDGKWIPNRCTAYQLFSNCQSSVNHIACVHVGKGYLCSTHCLLLSAIQTWMADALTYTIIPDPPSSPYHLQYIWAYSSWKANKNKKLYLHSGHFSLPLKMLFFDHNNKYFAIIILGVTYGNVCELQSLACLKKTGVRKEYNGECNAGE